MKVNPSTSTKMPQDNMIEVAREDSGCRKYVLVGVAVVTVVGMLVGVFFGGAYLYKSAVKDVVTRSVVIKDEDGHEVREQKESDITNNVVYHHVTLEDGEEWILYDFDKSLGLYKVEQGSDMLCFLSPLNVTDVSSPQASRVEGNNQKKVKKVAYELTGPGIENTEFLGKRMNDMCAGITVFWGLPACNADNDSKVENRKKRAAIRCGIPCLIVTVV